MRKSAVRRGIDYFGVRLDLSVEVPGDRVDDGASRENNASAREKANPADKGASKNGECELATLACSGIARHHSICPTLTCIRRGTLIVSRKAPQFPNRALPDVALRKLIRPRPRSGEIAQRPIDEEPPSPPPPARDRLAPRRPQGLPRRQASFQTQQMLRV